jgi:DNA-binding response OmpR family regulator
MIAIARDAAWTERLRGLAARGGWIFIPVAQAPVPGSATAEHGLIVLDRASVEGPLTRAVAALKKSFPAQRIVVSFSDAELNADGVADGLACGADDVVVKSWPDARLFARLSAAREAGLSAAVRVSADGALKAERRSHRAFTLARGKWRELPLPAPEFSMLWLLLAEDGAELSRERLLDALSEAAGRELEIETVSRRALSLRRALSKRWKGKIETVRGGFYRLVSKK